MKPDEMTIKQLACSPTVLRHILTYDSHVAKRLSVWQRMAVHQLIAGRKAAKPSFMRLLVTLHKEAAKWKAPEVRYNGNRELEIMDPKTGNFSLLNNNK